MTSSQLQQFFFKWLRRVTRLTVIDERQGKPRPQLPYVAFDISNASTRVGAIDETRASGESFSNHGLRTAIVSIDIIGPGALDAMAHLQQCLDLPEAVEEFGIAGVSHIGEDGPNDLSGLMETTYQERSQLDLRIMYGFEIESTVGPIESVGAVGTFDGQGQPEEISTEFETEN